MSSSNFSTPPPHGEGVSQQPRLTGITANSKDFQQSLEAPEQRQSPSPCRELVSVDYLQSSSLVPHSTEPLPLHPSHNSFPSLTMVAHRRGPWSQHEDQWLVNLVARNGPHNWVRISQEIGSRSPKQCRERYHQNLKPSLNHDPITPEEGELIEKMVHEMGKRWAEIARRLKGRSDNAVKNWWNGGQNRRKRNPERPDSRQHEQMHPSQASYHYPPGPQSLPHHEEQHISSYHSSRRPSISYTVNSPHAMKLPQPQRYEMYGSRPLPLELPAYGQPIIARARGFETPMPSPSGYSIVSTDGAPSLITDTGSESRSPRGAASPLDITLAPLVGGRDERRNSCIRYLPSTGFASEDDAHSTSYDPYRSRGTFQLPPMHRAEAPLSVPSSREATFDRPAPQHIHHHRLPQSASLSVPQRPLPPFQHLTEPSAASAASSPIAIPLSSSYARPALPFETRSAPVSPKDKMSLKNIM